MAIGICIAALAARGIMLELLQLQLELELIIALVVVVANVV